MAKRSLILPQTDTLRGLSERRCPLASHHGSDSGLQQSSWQTSLIFKAVFPALICTLLLTTITRNARELTDRMYLTSLLHHPNICLHTSGNEIFVFTKFEGQSLEDAAKARLSGKRHTKENHTVCRAGPHLATVARSTMSQVCGTQEGESMAGRGHLTCPHP